jgi:hypothetical protein
MHNFNEVRGNSQGQILDGDGNPITITVANLEANASVIISENYHENKESETIVSGHRIHISIEQQKEVDGYNYEKTFVRFVGDSSLELAVRDGWRSVVHSGGSGSTSDFEFRIHSVDANPYFDENIANLMANRNPTELVQLYTDITDIDMTMSGSQSNLYLLYDNDFHIYEGGNSQINLWQFRQQMRGGSLIEECKSWDWDTREELEFTSGTEAYNRCSSML